MKFKLLRDICNKYPSLLLDLEHVVKIVIKYESQLDECDKVTLERVQSDIDELNKVLSNE